MGQPLLLGCCVFLAIARDNDPNPSAAPRPDFRKAAWGMTPAGLVNRRVETERRSRKQRRSDRALRFDETSLSASARFGKTIRFLDPDRVAAADIPPFGRFVGVSISLVHLKLYAQWRGDRTSILHGLTGEDSSITDQIEFGSIEFEKLQGEVRAALRREPDDRTSLTDHRTSLQQ